MNFKKTFALLLALIMIVALAVSCTPKEPVKEPETPTQKPEAPEQEPVDPRPDWSEYDRLISEIKSTTDFANRVTLMHQAEDILMDTGAVMPIYYYNDSYMMRSTVQGMYANVFGTKFFDKATVEGSDTLRLQLASEPDRLDPALNSSVDGACLAAASFGGLYTYDEQGQLVPNFAESYTVSEDGLTYVFTLKEGLKWSDGSPLTAADFEYSWKRAANTETGADYAYMFSGIAGYDKVGEDPEALEVKAEGNTLTVNLIAPCAYMLDLMAFPTFFAVPQAAVESAAGYKDASGNIIDAGAWALEAGFVCSGPYKLESWTHEESMVYVKNENYWDAANVKLEKLEFMLSADDVAIYAAYRAGDLDFIDTVPNDEIKTLLETNDPEFYTVDNLGTYYVCFNVKSPLFEGKTPEQASAMRRAFSFLIDREYIVETVGQTGQVPATSFLPKGMLDGNGGIFKDANAWDYPNGSDGYVGTTPEVETAIELLESAGFKFENGVLSAETPISFEYIINESTGHVAIAECIQQDLAVVGINMTIKTLDWDTLLAERKAGNYDISRNGWIADFNDPINMLEMWITDSGNNDCQFGR
ncbi:MAG: Oligopeptide-binding protein OppA precursor [Firmicutes bacterium ADurb.Bin182]|nr:MAG: Oligopeptide-binding protein OppA precursor [Firmicutes bacterium ADurb.Bin182]